MSTNPSKQLAISEHDPNDQDQMGYGPVDINPAACERLAEIISKKTIPLDREEGPLPDFSDLEIGNFYLFLVAICHQTSPLGKPPLEGTLHGKYRKGWDYFSAKLEQAFQNDHRLFDPLEWSQMTGKRLASLLNDPQFGNRLTEPNPRAALIRDLGQVMLKNHWEIVSHAL